jgi:hypothetical protein
MTGRRLFSVLAIALGIVSFFLPVVRVTTLAHGPELRWSAYGVASEVVGVASENFYDVAAAIVYGRTGDDREPVRSTSQPPSGYSVVLAGVAATVISYCILVSALVLVLYRYSPRRVNRVAVIGLGATALALIATLIVAGEPIRPPDMGYVANVPGMIRMEVAYALYVLLVAFLALVLVQRAAALDRIFSPPE